ncbi:hypothetical protein PLESTM_001493700 [Pleodorina starrii]|nr:hypothetical protein PLESTM_001493600 [Pleodorina starrii]GLC43595.1 hypothetical protein PLESTM_001493700 [Pleodorina starrii]
MGTVLVKPKDTSDTKAIAQLELAVKGMHAMADNFFKDLRLGNASSTSLGYQLAGAKLTDQEYQIICRTEEGVTNSAISEAVKSIFSQDWQKLVECCVQEIVTFVTGDTTDTASTQEWSKSYLVWEDDSLMQYSVLIVKTASTSMGALVGNSKTTMLACACRGVVAYETVDPQIIVYELRKTNKGMNVEQFKKTISDVVTELGLASQLTAMMRHVTTAAYSGGDLPAPSQPVAPLTPSRPATPDT